DIITDISLFRPGPVKSDMVTPFLEARQGWKQEAYLHPDLHDALAQTCGVVVFHEQVLEIIATLAGCTLAEADEARRALGDPDARQFGIAVLPLDVNVSMDTYTIERMAAYDEPPPAILGAPPEPVGIQPGWKSDGKRYGIRLSLADVKGISDAEVARIIAGRPY